jgi:hypothetical protein
LGVVAAQVDPTRVTPNQANASVLMLQSAQSPATQFDVVDIDPYGSAAPFLDSAVQVRDFSVYYIVCRWDWRREVGRIACGWKEVSDRSRVCA